MPIATLARPVTSSEKWLYMDSISIHKWLYAAFCGCMQPVAFMPTSR